MLVDEIKYEKKPRTYYLAKASNGQMVVRGSNRDKYTHAVVWVSQEHKYPNQIVNGSFHKTQELAHKSKVSYDNWTKNSQQECCRAYEVVPVEKIPAKEVSRLKKLDKKSYQEYVESYNSIVNPK